MSAITWSPSPTNSYRGEDGLLATRPYYSRAPHRTKVEIHRVVEGYEVSGGRYLVTEASKDQVVLFEHYLGVRWGQTPSIRLEGPAVLWQTGWSDQNRYGSNSWTERVAILRRGERFKMTVTGPEAGEFDCLVRENGAIEAERHSVATERV